MGRCIRGSGRDRRIERRMGRLVVVWECGMNAWKVIDISMGLYRG
jgi:hypothetical protein